MTQAILTVFLLLVWFIMNRKKDYYLVETRICSDEKITSKVLGLGNFCHDVAFTKCMSTGELAQSYKNEFKLVSGLCNPDFVHKDGGTVHIRQEVFTDANAATLFYENEKKTRPYGYAFQRVYIWRVLARSRGQVNVFNELKTILPQLIYGLQAPKYTLMSAHPENGHTKGG